MSVKTEGEGGGETTTRTRTQSILKDGSSSDVSSLERRDDDDDDENDTCLDCIFRHRHLRRCGAFKAGISHFCDMTRSL